MEILNAGTVCSLSLKQTLTFLLVAAAILLKQVNVGLLVFLIDLADLRALRQLVDLHRLVLSFRFLVLQLGSFGVKTFALFCFVNYEWFVLAIHTWLRQFGRGLPNALVVNIQAQYFGLLSRFNRRWLGCHI